MNVTSPRRDKIFFIGVVVEFGYDNATPIFMENQFVCERYVCVVIEKTGIDRGASLMPECLGTGG